MADLSSVSEAAKSIGDLIAGFVPEGPLRQAVLVVEGLCGLAAPVTYKYYIGVLAQGGSRNARWSGRSMAVIPTSGLCAYLETPIQPSVREPCLLGITSTRLWVTFSWVKPNFPCSTVRSRKRSVLFREVTGLARRLCAVHCRLGGDSISPNPDLLGGTRPCRPATRNYARSGIRRSAGYAHHTWFGCDRS
jgi:hypothetical protein